MFRSLLFFSLVVACYSAFSQERCDVRLSDVNRLTVAFTAPDRLDVGNVTLDGINFATVSVDGFVQSSAIGAPSLPTMRKLIEIPLCDGVDVKIVSESHVVIDGEVIGVTNLVEPVQPPVSKSDSRNAEALAFNEALYLTDAFSGIEPVTVEPVGVARDRNLAELVFSPVKYNPVTNKFLVYTEVEAVLTYRDADIVATREMKALHASLAFGNDIATINSLDQRGLGVKGQNDKLSNAAPIRYLIVSHHMFRGQFEEFVNWKRRTGYIVDVAYTDDAAVGNSQTSIKSFIKSQYTNATASNPAPTYLLLVGDIEQIPAKSYAFSSGGSSHVSDLDYACWTDGDEIPDCYYGRFSAQSVSQLTAQVEKTLLYERYEFPDPSFLDRAILVAGVDGGSSDDYGYTHADPTMDYAAKFYVNGDSKSVLGHNGFYKYASVSEYKNKTSINMNATAVAVRSNTYEAEVRNKYSEGAGWINYSAHGNYNGWHKPSFTNTHVAAMTNSKKCGVVIGNCCLTGKFDERTCFAEALLRRDNYCGAVAYIGCSNSSYWNQDVYWSVGYRTSISGSMTQAYNADKMGIYDHLFHSHGELFDTWATTLGAIVWYGNMAVQGSSSTNAYKSYYWQIYHVFGDPSLMPWLSQAKEMPLSYSIVEDGATHISVNTIPHAYVAITDNGYNLVGAAFANIDGVADIECNQVLDSENYYVSAVAQNYQPKVVPLDRLEPVATVNLRCFPVPAAVSVGLTIDGLDDAVEYEIVDIKGRVVYWGSETSGNAVHNVDVSNYSVGTYFVRAVGHSFWATGKIVVSH